MKKLLAMVLALVMTLSLAVSASAFKDDKDVSDTYAEAVAVLNGMGVFKGYEDGSFQPKGDITRAEVAAIVYRVYTADVKDAKASLYATYNKFSDMTGAGWAAGYIGYCANAELVKGYPNGTFQPSGKVTGYEVLAMILRAIGYDKNGEFSGADWALHVAQTAQQAGVLANVKGVDLNAPATRELVAELLFRAIAESKMVTYTPAFGYVTDKVLGDKNGTLGFENFKLKSDDTTSDEFGRPTKTWTYDVGDKKTVVEVEALASYTEAAKNCDIYADSGLKKGTVLKVYTNSAKNDGTYTVADNKNDSAQANQGRLTLVYEDRLVNIDTYLANVKKAVAEKTDSKGHVDAAYVLVDEIYDFDGKFTDKFETDDAFKADDMVLVTVADGEIQSMVAAEAKDGVLTDVSGNAKNIDSVQKIKGIDKTDVKVNWIAGEFAPESMTLGKTYTYYFDTYGNVIGVDELASNYVVLDTLYTETVKGTDTAYGDLYFFDGDSKTDVTINEVDGDDVSEFEAASSKNYNYYYTVYAYNIDKDGAYTLDDSAFVDTYYTASYTSGDKYLTAYKGDLSGDSTRLQLNGDSKILVQTKDSPKGTFTAYTGYDKLPSFKGYAVQYTTVNGYVDMMYVYAYEVTTRTVFIYDTTAYQSHYNDGKPYATFNAYELVDGKLEDTKIDLYYGEYNDEVSHNIEAVGLYEITVGSDDVWNVSDKYHAYSIDQLTTDGKRVYVNGTWFDLDDALVAKYEGTFTKGEIDEDWTAKDLTEDSFVFVQYDDSKSGNTHDALVVYDLYIEALVNEKTGNNEYYGKDFAPITVALEGQQYVSAPVMENDDESIELKVTYFDKDGEEVNNQSADKVKAVIDVKDRNQKVTGDITYGFKTLQAYTKTALKEGTYNFEAASQSAVVAADSITVNTNGQTVTVANLKALLEEAKSNAKQTIEVYNTNDVELASGEVASDMYVKVTAWDGKTTANYQITVNDAVAGA